MYQRIQLWNCRLRKLGGGWVSDAEVVEELEGKGQLTCLWKWKT
jgi:hypothetical protein